MASGRLANILEEVDDVIQAGRGASEEREALRAQERAVFEGFSRSERLKIIRLANDQRRRIFANQNPHPGSGLLRRLREYKDSERGE